MFSFPVMKILFAIAVALIAPLAFAEEKKPAEPAKPADPAKPAEPAKSETPAAADKVFAPTALVELKPLVGKKITVEAPIVVQGENKTGTVRYLNFTTKFRESLSLTFFASAGDGKFTKEKLAEFVGKKVRVTGELGEFNGALQIKMTSLDQIKIVE